MNGKGDGPLLPLSSGGWGDDDPDGARSSATRRILIAGHEICSYTPTPDSAGGGAASTLRAALAELRAPAAFVAGRVLAPAAVFVVALLVNVAGSGVNLSAAGADRQSCQNDCFDGKFKGAHGGNVRGYKYVYFNMERTTLWILLWFLLYMQVLAAGLGRAASLAVAGRLRWGPFLVLAASFFSHFYGSWCVFNYLNESGLGTQPLLASQLFFSLTELASAYCLLPFADARYEYSENEAGSGGGGGCCCPARLALPLIVAAGHVAIALTERVLWGLLGLGGSILARDLLLVAGDAATLAWAGARLRRAAPRLARLALGPLRAPPLAYVPLGAAALFVFYKAFCAF
eukprot:tig00020806_g14032.t1